MRRRILVGYDGSDAARRALDFAIARARAEGGRVLILHVLEWSPYSFLSPSELEEHHLRRKEELARAQEAIVAPMLARAAQSGISADSKVKYGHIAETLCQIAADDLASMIVIGRTGQSGPGARVFGSVAATLAQTSPVPVTIVP
jgi:nucleotide-binding universal stress UspA family protein